ncbi:MAG: hypothetical protein J6Y44_02060 [Clostridia bacterium]|nr:hypothetical protein [Clostridia bacterium]
MKKARDILFLVGKIYSFVVGGVYFATSLMFFFFFIFLASSGEIVYDDEIAWMSFMLSAASFFVFTIVFIVVAILMMVNGKLSSRARVIHERGTYIKNIVFGALSGVPFNVIAAIFGLILLKREEEKYTATP